MKDKPLGRARSTETKYARTPLWLFETETTLQAKATYAWLHGRYGHYDLVVPSYNTLAKELGVSKGSVINYVKELVEVGAIVAIERYTDSGQTTNEYVIAFNEPFEVVNPLTTDELGEHDEGGQPADTGGQNTDQGGQPADQTGQPAGTRKKTSYTDVPKKTPFTSKAKPPTPPTDEVLRLCDDLADRIEANGSLRPTIGQRWYDAARLMMSRDGRTAEQIHAAIAWSQDDEFWRSNILSMAKLREKYDRLRLDAQRKIRQAQGAGTVPRQSTTDQRVQVGLDLVAELEALEAAGGSL